YDKKNNHPAKMLTRTQNMLHCIRESRLVLKTALQNACFTTAECKGEPLPVFNPLSLTRVIQRFLCAV
ncbi:MAG: hypothetical protein RR848_10380, partial [Oscillospiraceae bacterium]